MLKVMHVLNSRRFSGAENVVITIINGTKSEIDSTYVSPYGLIKDKLQVNDIQYFPLKRLSVLELKRAIGMLNPEIIHAHDFIAGVISALSTSKIPIINHVHQNPPWLKHINIKTLTYAAASLRFRTIFMVSDSIRKEYVFKKFIADKSLVIGNPISTKRIRALAEINSEITSNDEFHSDLVFLGRLDYEKNPECFIKIVENIKKSMCDIRAIMIGDGSKKEECEAYIAKHNLSKNIFMTGYVDNPYRLLSMGKILCIPSIWEGFGLAAIEGMALGKPIVCADVGGLKVLIDDNVGRKCQKEIDYYDEILSLLSNPSYYKKKSEAARYRATQLDNLENYIKSIKYYYNLFS